MRMASPQAMHLGSQPQTGLQRLTPLKLVQQRRCLQSVSRPRRWQSDRRRMLLVVAASCQGRPWHSRQMVPLPRQVGTAVPIGDGCSVQVCLWQDCHALAQLDCCW